MFLVEQSYRLTRADAFVNYGFLDGLMGALQRQDDEFEFHADECNYDLGYSTGHRLWKAGNASE